MGPTSSLGGNGGYQHDGLFTGHRFSSEICVAGWRRDRCRNLVALVCVARVALSIHHCHLSSRALLASA